MSAVATPARERERSALARRGSLPRRRPFDDRATLEGEILSAWEGLVVEGRCACPVCDAPMTAGSGHAACAGCGAELS